ncbi:NUDIX hydrolase domain-like protein [Tribonema minus]|uniref:NUDIX hydrolase domain-like protein n=1 Tax=Tribonema minus TaxID=303371 RepID=A0A835YMT5_9STRA|nr:NUDIX hydrolase domain-like protein [Tribonema minus]
MSTDEPCVLCHCCIQGELLMQRRSKFKDTYPGMWDVSVGGHMTAGDDSLLTAKKETAEELGINFNDTDLEFLFTIATSAQGSTERHGNFNCNEYKDVYMLRYNGGLAEIHFSEGEVEEVRWEPYDQVEQRLTSNDAAYIPRPTDYVTGLFTAVRDRL